MRKPLYLRNWRAWREAAPQGMYSPLCRFEGRPSLVNALALDMGPFWRPVAVAHHSYDGVLAYDPGVFCVAPWPALMIRQDKGADPDLSDYADQLFKSADAYQCVIMAEPGHDWARIIQEIQNDNDNPDDGELSAVHSVHVLRLDKLLFDLFLNLKSPGDVLEQELRAVAGKLGLGFEVKEPRHERG